MPEVRPPVRRTAGFDPELAAQVAALHAHCCEWDCRITADSTAATLCEAWYEELYGTDYPAETLLPQYVEIPRCSSRRWSSAAEQAQSHATATGASPWGDCLRIQRKADMVDLLELPFDDRLPSLPSLGGPGPMGVVFTQYYSPPVNMPFVMSLKKQYGLVGASVHGASTNSAPRFAASSAGALWRERRSQIRPTYFDQAQLLSDRKLKPELFDWPDVLAGTVETYHPGEAQERSVAKAL